MNTSNGRSGVRRFEPEEEDLGKRIDLYLSERIEDLSRTRIQELIEAGRVATQLGLVRKSNFKLRQEGWVEISLPTPEEYEVPPEDLPIDILYEDSDLAVVVKPPGMPTHPTPSRIHGTLVNALRFRLKDLSGIGGLLRPGIVHRLDRVTSGLLVVAKNQQAHVRLSDQFRKRTVKKIYRALCLGRDPGAKGVIVGLLDRHPTRRKKWILGTTGRISKTSYQRILSKHPLYGLLLFPHTGRTHQLRAHLESLHLSIVLDTLYGYESHRWPHAAQNPLLKEYPGILLHAEQLEFDQSTTGERLHFEVEPPEVFRRVWEELCSFTL